MTSSNTAVLLDSVASIEAPPGYIALGTQNAYGPSFLANPAIVDTLQSLSDEERATLFRHALENGDMDQAFRLIKGKQLNVHRWCNRLGYVSPDYTYLTALPADALAAEGVDRPSHGPSMPRPHQRRLRPRRRGGRRRRRRRRWRRWWWWWLAADGGGGGSTAGRPLAHAPAPSHKPMLPPLPHSLAARPATVWRTTLRATAPAAPPLTKRRRRPCYSHCHGRVHCRPLALSASLRQRADSRHGDGRPLRPRLPAAAAPTTSSPNAAATPP